MDDGDGKDAPIAATGTEHLFWAVERPGKDQDRREFDGKDDAEHSQDTPVLQGLKGLDAQRTSVRVRR